MSHDGIHSLAYAETPEKRILHFIDCYLDKKITAI